MRRTALSFVLLALAIAWSSPDARAQTIAQDPKTGESSVSFATPQGLLEVSLWIAPNGASLTRASLDGAAITFETLLTPIANGNVLVDLDFGSDGMLAVELDLTSGRRTEISNTMGCEGLSRAPLLHAVVDVVTGLADGRIRGGRAGRDRDLWTAIEGTLVSYLAGDGLAEGCELGLPFRSAVCTDASFTCLDADAGGCDRNGTSDCGLGCALEFTRCVSRAWLHAPWRQGLSAFVPSPR